MYLGEYKGAWVEGQYAYMTWTENRVTAAGTLFSRNQSDIRSMKITPADLVIGRSLGRRGTTDHCSMCHQLAHERRTVLSCCWPLGMMARRRVIFVANTVSLDRSSAMINGSRSLSISRPTSRASPTSVSPTTFTADSAQTALDGEGCLCSGGSRPRRRCN